MTEETPRPNNVVDFSERLRAKENEGKKDKLSVTSDGYFIYPERKMQITLAEAREIAKEILNNFRPLTRLTEAWKKWELVKQSRPDELLLEIPETYHAISAESVMQSLNLYRDQVKSTNDERLRALIEEHRLKRIQFDPVYLYAMAEKLAEGTV